MTGKMMDFACVDLVLNNVLGLKLKHQSPYCHKICLLNLKSDEICFPLLSAYQFLPKIDILQ